MICHVCRKKGHQAATCGIIKIAGANSMYRDDLSRYKAGLENTFPGESGLVMALTEEVLDMEEFFGSGVDGVFDNMTPVDSIDITAEDSRLIVLEDY